MIYRLVYIFQHLAQAGNSLETQEYYSTQMYRDNIAQNTVAFIAILLNCHDEIQVDLDYCI